MLPTVAGLVVILISALGLPAEPHYSVPVAPAFVLFASGAIFAPRRARALAWRRAPGLARPFVGAAIGVAAAVWAAWHYVSGVRGSVDNNGAPHDLSVFLTAAGRALHLASPYAYLADQTYAYPPLLAFLLAPLHPLGAGAATVVWLAISLAAMAGRPVAARRA